MAKTEEKQQQPTAPAKQVPTETMEPRKPAPKAEEG